MRLCLGAEAMAIMDLIIILVTVTMTRMRSYIKWIVYSLICIEYYRLIFLIHAGAQVRFAELKKMADNRANIGGTITGEPIVGQ